MGKGGNCGNMVFIRCRAPFGTLLHKIIELKSSEGGLLQQLKFNVSDSPKYGLMLD